MRERLKLLKEKGRLPGVVAFYSPDFSGETNSLTFDGEQVEVRRCDCVLEIRDFLAARDANSTTAVMLTRVPYEELGQDVLARLAGRKLFRADSWAAVMSRFHAINLDPRLVREGWIADQLMDVPGNEFPAVPNGYLSIETVWQTLLGRFLGLGDERPDALALLRWLAAPGTIDRYSATAESFRSGFRRWVEMTAGEVGAAIADCIETTRNGDAIAVGLVLDVLSQPANGSDSAMHVCAARLERLHGNHPLSDAAARKWALAARALVDERPADAPGWISRADELLTNIDADAYAVLSDVSPLGFKQRADRYAQAILTVLGGAAIEDAETAADGLERHREARIGRTAERVAMSRRLLRWLAGKTSVPLATSLAEAALVYVNCGAWIDRARTLLRGGDPQASLSHAYEALLERARAEREKENHRFGKLLVEWNAGAPRHEAIIPVEELIERVLAPIAANAPVLMVVLDGVSLPIFYEFLDNLKQRNWTILGRKITGKQVLPITPAIAAIPSITEVSRASLLAGKLVRGTSRLEKEQFASNPLLLQVSRGRRPPILFHKGELTEPGGTELSATVREALSSAEQRVVGVVINAIDDHLSGPDQVRPEWTLEYLSPQIKGLLDEAEAASRIVIFTGDHGHVLDADSELRPSGYGERWREAAGEPQAEELIISGGRVDPGYGARIIAPLSERVRYGPRKNGYHGGISPQEIVVPVCVMARLWTKLEGWVESWPATPAWWQGAQAAPAQRMLFAGVHAPETSDELKWLDRLFKTATFKSQRQLAGAGAAPDMEARQLIEILAGRGGRMPASALAQRLGVAPARVQPRIAAIRRLLNVEGYQVLSYDYESQTVELDIEMLRKQFEL